MKIKELREKMKEFQKTLQEYYNLRNSRETYRAAEKKEQFNALQKQLYRHYYILDPFLTKYGKGRTKAFPSYGITWDIYRDAIGGANEITTTESIKDAILQLEGIIAVLETENPDDEASSFSISTKSEKKVFISHGKESNALTKIERFLRGLGITPVIVKNEPSKGKSLDDLVEEQMRLCDSVLILATKDDKVENYYQPRPNVIHEIGLAQEIVKNKIIYLKEDDCQFPSNITPKVWGSFTQDNMENAFLKIGKELKAFGIIQ